MQGICKCKCGITHHTQSDSHHSPLYQGMHCDCIASVELYVHIPVPAGVYSVYIALIQLFSENFYTDTHGNVYAYRGSDLSSDTYASLRFLADRFWSLRLFASLGVWQA